MSLESIISMIGGIIGIISVFISWYTHQKLKQIEEERIMSHLDIDLKSNIKVINILYEDKEKAIDENILCNEVKILNKGEINSFIEALEVEYTTPNTEKSWGIAVPEDKNEWYRIFDYPEELVDFDKFYKIILDDGYVEGKEKIKEPGVIWKYTYQLNLKNLIDNLLEELEYQVHFNYDLVTAFWEQMEIWWEQMEIWMDELLSIGETVAKKFPSQILQIFSGQTRSFFTKIPFFKNEWIAITISLQSVRAKKIRTKEIDRAIGNLEDILALFILFLLLYRYYSEPQNEVASWRRLHQLIEDLKAKIQPADTSKKIWSQKIDEAAAEEFEQILREEIKKLEKRVEDDPDLGSNEKRFISDRLCEFEKKVPKILPRIEALFKERAKNIAEVSDITQESFMIYLK
ncbi:MAG: hypothetical protein ACTSRS_18340 [Candidatus Helarchaeota archaeon]